MNYIIFETKKTEKHAQIGAHQLVEFDLDADAIWPCVHSNSNLLTPGGQDAFDIRFLLRGVHLDDEAIHLLQH
ncbi:MAG: hypothetical protein A2W07_09080 [candidate division Zixibacteria bacterium RBG_16_43_9]|nr:MAG: hypothetical protein A2W07_09080 [candidate division Zixibacteria bacterium RBG_16_43_9]